VVVTQPNNKLSRVLKALLRELPAQLAAADAAGLQASEAMSEGAAAVAAPEALDYAREKLAERQRLVRGVQASERAPSRPAGGAGRVTLGRAARELGSLQTAQA
jgi:hypothetical protein